MKYISLTYLFLLLASVTMLSSCRDDFDPGMDGVVDGSIVEVPVTITFDSETVVDLESRAMDAQPGTAIQNINSFWMVVYDENGELFRKYHIRENGNNLQHPDISDISYTDNSDNRLPHESALGDDAAGRLQYNLKIPSARYYVYGVANVAGFDEMDISSRNDLKSIQCPWDSVAIANNSEMYGIFSIGQNRNASDSDPITVVSGSKNVQNLHCWLRRLASKVTIAFDGTDLYDNVEVYIDTIMICDVPKNCYLGLPNSPGFDVDNPESRLPAADRYKVDNGVYPVGGMDVIQKPGAADVSFITPQTFYHICNSSHIYGGVGSQDGNDAQINKHRHSHTAKSLYFYENLQGIGKNKAQSSNGTSIDFPEPIVNDLTSGWKDGKAYGTYIEVRGFYRNTAPDGSVGSGWIKYRFMLGKDVRTNYDALRNTHYKLTLKLRGYANDYDWHIDYHEDTGIYMSNPVYISYIYNKLMYMSIKVVGEMEPGSKLQAEILPSDDPKYMEWGPWGNGRANEAGEIEFPDPRTKTVVGPDGTPLNMFLDNPDAMAKGPHTSFLSLWNSNVLRVDHPAYTGKQSNNIDVDLALSYLKDYYDGNESFNPGIGEGKREYAIDEESSQNEDYSVQITSYHGETPVERYFRIPLFTRSKELVTRTGFTGNNPYESYPRKMRVKFTASIKDRITGQYKPTEFILDVLQVRRIVNPKGIWRRSGSTTPFHVTLLHLPEDDATEFRQFTSSGKWSAEILAQGDPIISLSSTPEGSGDGAHQSHVRRVEGEDEHPVDFKVNFNGAPYGYAIIRVRYHNYTCEHDIFCMVGMEPVELDPTSKVKWHPTNVYRFDANNCPVYATNPLQEGSLFRRNSRVAITPTNSKVDDVDKTTAGDATVLHVLLPGSTTETTKTWDQLRTETQYLAGGAVKIGSPWTIPNANERIASCQDDFYTITTVEENMEFTVKKAYGVLYGEGSEAPRISVADAYGYDSQTGADIDKGMRGVFVYNLNTAQTMFMPIGMSGHGRRKSGKGWQPAPEDPAATMRYASRTVANSAMTKQPIFYDLYRKNGALYWCREYVADGDNDVDKSSAFDINYYTMGFEGFCNGAITPVGDVLYSDAAYIRTVHIDPPHHPE